MKKEDFENILLSLNIGNQEFFTFLQGKVKSYPLKVHEFPWATFPKIDQDGRIYDIRVIVPSIVDDDTLCVNIHEYTHAFEYYEHLGEIYYEDVERSEASAKTKEREYLNSKRNK